MYPRMNKRTIGKEQEELAKEYLVSQGYQIQDINFWCRIGEIDIIAKEGSYLTFIEVKFRKNLDRGAPEEAITPSKIHTITRTAQFYMLKRGIPEDTPCRFDVVVILDKKITLYRDAFEADTY